MAAKSEKMVQDERVREAIRSLYELHPEVPKKGYRSNEPVSPKVRELERKIKARQKELDADKEMVRLQEELEAETNQLADTANLNHAKVDALMRRFNLRGVSEPLLRDVEAMAEVKPVRTESR